MTLEKVAEELGVSLNMVNLWESGRSFPMPEKLTRLAEVYRVSADWLLGTEEKIEVTEEEMDKYLARIPLWDRIGAHR